MGLLTRCALLLLLWPLSNRIEIWNPQQVRRLLLHQVSALRLLNGQLLDLPVTALVLDLSGLG